MRSDRDPTASLPLQVQLLGRFAVRDARGEEVALRRHARALVAMLSLAREPLERDLVSRILWPGRFASQAKASLRQLLFELGQAFKPLGEDPLDVGRTAIAVRPDIIETDVEALFAYLADGRADEAAAVLAHGTHIRLLEQFDLGPAFAEWCSERAREIERRITSAIDACSARLAEAGRFDERNRLIAALPAPAPLSTRADHAADAADRAPRRIAVLPFELVSRDREQRYFADGLADELISVLGGIPQLAVAGRTSSFHFRDSPLSAPEIAAALQVTHLLEGSVQCQGNAVRIFVRLIDGQTGFETWNGRYNGSLDDVFSLQDTVARSVTDALSAQFGLTLPRPAARQPTNSKLAYDLYLQGRAMRARVFGDGMPGKALVFFERALALDPGFAEAWAALGEAHLNVAFYTHCTDRGAAMASAAACARRAIELNAGLGHPYCLLATYEFTRNNVVGALDLAFEGYRIDPGNSDIGMRLGQLLLYCGLSRRAEPYLLAALDKDPVEPRNHILLSGLRYAQGDYRAAQVAGQVAVDLGFPSVYLAMATAALGQNALAVEQYQITRREVDNVLLPPTLDARQRQAVMDAYWMTAAKGVCSGDPADRETYRQLLEYMFQTLPDSTDSAICYPAIFIGDGDLVFKSLGQRFTAPNILGLMTLWADIDPVRAIWDHPGFGDFVRRTGLLAAWERYGWPDPLEARRETI